MNANLSCGSLIRPTSLDFSGFMPSMHFPITMADPPGLLRADVRIASPRRGGSRAAAGSTDGAQGMHMSLEVKVLYPT